VVLHIDIDLSCTMFEFLIRSLKYSVLIFKSILFCEFSEFLMVVILFSCCYIST